MFFRRDGTALIDPFFGARGSRVAVRKDLSASQQRSARTVSVTACHARVRDKPVRSTSYRAQRGVKQTKADRRDAQGRSGRRSIFDGLSFYCLPVWTLDHGIVDKGGSLVAILLLIEYFL